MKKFIKLICVFSTAISVFTSPVLINKVSAGTKEDVIAAAKQAGISDIYLQQGLNYLESNNYSSEQYDQIIGQIYSYKNSTDDAIEKYFEGTSSQTQPAVTETSIVETTKQENIAVNVNTEVATTTQTEKFGALSPEEQKEKLSNMTTEEKKEFISSLSSQEKNSIIKNLPNEDKIEIINELIDTGSQLGMNFTVDEFTKESLAFSVRDDQGELVDVSSMGIVIDETGINYSKIMIICVAVILVSLIGVAITFKKTLGVENIGKDKTKK